jgi:hypothetical protein
MSSPKENELIRKHKPLTKEEVERKFKENDEMKKKLSTDSTILERNLVNFNKITDPIVDPVSGEPLCWVRRPTQIEWEEMLPDELLEYRNKPEEIPEEVWKKCSDLQFTMMEKLIDKPQHDSKWWKEHSNLVFQQLFQMHLNSLFELLGFSAENF